MALPLTRNTTYADGSPALAPDLNDIQDCIITGKHGDRVLIVPACAFQIHAPAANIAAGTIPSCDGKQWEFATVSGLLGGISAPLGLPVGKRIKSVDWVLNKASDATAMVLRLRKHVLGGGSVSTTNLVTNTDVSSAATYITNAMAAINHTIAAAEAMDLHVLGATGPFLFSHAIVTYDQPT